MGVTWQWLFTQPPTTQTISISAISQLLLTQFWANFKGRFWSPFLTGCNCNDDICPSNIRPGHICQYRKYLSCYWSNLDHSFLPKLYFYKNFFGANFFLKHIFFKIFVFTPLVFDPESFWDIYFLTKYFFGPKSIIGP